MAHKDYKCTKCKHTFEKFTRTLSEKVVCEKCGSEVKHMLTSAPVVKIPVMHRAVSSK